MNPPPNDVDVEDELLGGLMMNPHLIADVRPVLAASDFYRQGNGLLYDTVLAAWDAGEQPAPVVLADRLKREGRLDQVAGHAGISDRWRVGAPGAVGRHAGTIVDLAFRRRLLAAATQVAAAARDEANRDPMGVAERALAGIDVPMMSEPAGVHRLADLATSQDNQGEWLLEDLIGVQERLMIVAAEGAGKSILCRQVGMLAAAGIHPYTLRALDEPVRVLHIDLENPVWIVRMAVRRLHLWLEARKRATAGRIWLQPQGIDLRTRRGRSELEALVRSDRPDLLILGPLYKTHQLRGGESFETAGLEVQSVLDDLRIRYGFSLVIEHHAAKGQGGGGVRDLKPYGSSVWLRWMEYGRTLSSPEDAKVSKDVKAKTPATSMIVGTFRGDRRPVDWPFRFDRGKEHEVPWVACWDHGKLLDVPEADPEAPF